MIEKILYEIRQQCDKCQEKCKKQDCVLFRIKTHCGYFFQCENASIDDFFKTVENKQLSVFDVIKKDGL